jgi:glycosyltransferase involved in cell wall biosynthesis
VELVIVGEGDERGALQSLIDRLGRADRIRLLGYRADIAGIYRAFDIFGLTSIREGLPNVLLEAMTCEVPVVSEPVGGIPGLIEDGHCGLLVNPSAGHSLEHCLARLVVDADWRSRMGLAGRKRVEDCYTFEARMKKICKLYDDLLPQSRPVLSRSIRSAAREHSRLELSRSPRQRRWG